MHRDDALDDLKLVRRILEQSHRRVDPQMFHFLIWGVIVLLWYPAMNALELVGRRDLHLLVSLGALGTGVAASAFLGWRASRHPRLRAANTHLARQCGALVAVFVVSGLLLSAVVPAAQRGGERFIPHVWGFLYALMSMTLGIVYSREFLWAGIAIFAGAVAALVALPYSGFILGAVMGIGLIVPGLLAERRVARMMNETTDADL